MVDFLLSVLLPILEMIRDTYAWLISPTGIKVLLAGTAFALLLELVVGKWAVKDDDPETKRIHDEAERVRREVYGK